MYCNSSFLFCSTASKRTFPFWIMIVQTAFPFWSMMSVIRAVRSPKGVQLKEFIREIDTRLVQWAQSKSFRPLIVRGVRQSGKTAAIRKLGRRQFATMVELNFERDPSLARIFAESLDARKIASTIEALFNQRLVEGE